MIGTPLRHRPTKTLNRLQKAIVQLDKILSSRLYVRKLYDYLAEKEGVRSTAIEYAVQSGKGPHAASVLELIEETARSVQDGDRDLEQLLSSNLIPLDSFPDPTDCVQKLNFKSLTALCWAVSEATGVEYGDISHYWDKNTRRKHGRIEVRDCLEDWLDAIKRGKEPNINPAYRGVKKETILSLVQFILESKTYDKKTHLAGDVSDKTRIPMLRIRNRYFYQDSTTHIIPIEVYQCLKTMFKPYSSAESYKKGDLLYDTSADDYGIVRISGKERMAVKWIKRGSLIMAQNDRY